MKIKFAILSMLLVIAGSVSQLSAQEAQDPTAGLQPLSLEYSGWEFQVPPGATVTRDARMTITYPGQSLFGMSLVNQEVRGSNQKRAYEMCQRSAKEFRLENPKVEKVSISGAKGAKATGRSEGVDVTILILPTNDNELTMVIMADPERSGAAEAVISSLKH